MEKYLKASRDLSPNADAACVAEATTLVPDKRYLVKVKGYPPEAVWARNRSAAKYRAGKLMEEAGITRSAITVAWHRVEWVRREDLDGDPRTPAYGVAP